MGKLLLFPSSRTTAVANGISKIGTKSYVLIQSSVPVLFSNLKLLKTYLEYVSFLLFKLVFCMCFNFNPVFFDDTVLKLS